MRVSYPWCYKEIRQNGGKTPNNLVVMPRKFASGRGKLILPSLRQLQLGDKYVTVSQDSSTRSDIKAVSESQEAQGRALVSLKVVGFR